MAPGFDPGALLARTYPLAHGPRVCLRLVRTRDLPAVGELLARQGIEVDEFELARLVNFDRRRRLVLCATALIGSAEMVVGVGAIELEPEPASAPTMLIVDADPGAHADAGPGAGDGLAALLSDALAGRAQALSRARAA